MIGELELVIVVFIYKHCLPQMRVKVSNYPLKIMRQQISSDGQIFTQIQVHTVFCNYVLLHYICNVCSEFIRFNRYLPYSACVLTRVYCGRETLFPHSESGLKLSLCIPLVEL